MFHINYLSQNHMQIKNIKLSLRIFLLDAIVKKKTSNPMAVT